MKYHKIQSIYKRDKKGKFIIGQWSLSEFEYLKDNTWIWTEKVDGMNIRAIWKDNEFRFAGRTDVAEIPSGLYVILNSIFNTQEVLDWMRVHFLNAHVVFYGEGYGRNIQKTGKRYSKNYRFILFDIAIIRDKPLWLERTSVEEISEVLYIPIVPIVGKGSIDEAIEFVKSLPKSRINPEDETLVMEGLVLKPEVSLFNRQGKRIITKVKWEDFV